VQGKKSNIGDNVRRDFAAPWLSTTNSISQCVCLTPRKNEKISSSPKLNIKLINRALCHSDINLFPVGCVDGGGGYRLDSSTGLHGEQEEFPSLYITAGSEEERVAIRETIYILQFWEARGPKAADEYYTSCHKYKDYEPESMYVCMYVHTCELRAQRSTHSAYLVPKCAPSHGYPTSWEKSTSPISANATPPPAATA
jgi:hypothetical protein